MGFRKISYLCGMHCPIFCVPTEATSALHSGVGEGTAGVLAQSQDKVRPALPEGDSWVMWANPHCGEEMRPSCPRQQSEEEAAAAAL